MIESIKESENNIEILKQLKKNEIELSEKALKYIEALEDYFLEFNKLNNNSISRQEMRDNNIKLLISLHQDTNNIAILCKNIKGSFLKQQPIILEELKNISKIESGFVNEITRTTLSIKKRKHVKQRIINGLISLISAALIVDAYFSISSPFIWLMSILCLIGIITFSRREKQHEDRLMRKLLDSKDSIMRIKSYKSYIYSIQKTLESEQHRSDLLEQKVTSILDRVFSQLKSLEDTEC